MYILKIPNCYASDDNIVVYIELDTNESFIIIADSVNYNIIGFPVDMDEIQLKTEGINKDDYIRIDIKFNDNSIEAGYAVKPDAENEFISSYYTYFDSFKEWCENLDKNEFKKKIIDALI